MTDEFDRSLIDLEHGSPALLSVNVSLLLNVETSFQSMLADAQLDPQKWADDHAAEMKKLKDRRIVKRVLRKHMPDLDEATHATGEQFLDAVTTGQALPGMSDEWKARLHAWIQRALPVLKIIAGVVPPPYNLIVIAFTVLLALIDANRLAPKDLVEAVAASFGS